MGTNMISQLQESFPLKARPVPFQVSFTKWLFLRYAFAEIELFSSSLEFRLFGTENISIIVFISLL